MSTPASLLPLHAPAIQELFAAYTFHEGTLPNLTDEPSRGFEPTRLALGADHPAHGTEVLFLPTPESLGPAFASEVAPVWENGVGLVLYRHAVSQVLGAIFVHGLVRNPWNLIQSEALQALGGVMLFSDNPKENKTAMDLIRDVIRKAVAMTLKWQFIDMNLSENLKHPILTLLGGGKATASHPEGLVGRFNAVVISATIADMLGFYISGSDQNMSKFLCSLFAQWAPRNFMGAEFHPIPSYGGMGDPSRWTALGGAEGLRVIRREIFGGEKVPILFQGYGNAGGPLVEYMVEDGHPVSGLLERDLAKLGAARKAGIKGPFFLEVPAGTSEPDPSDLRDVGATVVRNLVEAIGLAKGSLIFSPNAGPHPITMDVADAIIAAGILANCGITNNAHDLVGGSIEPVVRKLQSARVPILSVADSEENQIGAFSVAVGRVNPGLSPDKDLVTRMAQGVGAQTLRMIRAFRAGVPPQIARDRVAGRRYNDQLDQGRAFGGRFADTGKG